ncbi:MAG: type VI secretion system protein TssA [Deltaproteobacteria bacterium]|jgi:type VI secretion system protein VasJ|nr:type VI secretion system protein TssA [Deltaproteobacteria bacterium]
MIKEELVKLGTDPIPGDNPAGREIRSEADYQAIQAEIERLSALSTLSGDHAGVNWLLIKELGQKILAQDSKDLTVAIYLAHSYLETEPIEVLGSTATFLADFLENFWDSFYPPVNRLRARKNSLDWWREKTITVLKRFTGEVESFDQAEMYVAIKRLDQILADRDLVNLIEVVNVVKNLTIKAEAPEPTPPAKDAAPKEAASSGSSPEPSASPAASQPADSNQAPSPTNAAQSQKDFLRVANDYLLTHPEPKDPWRWKIAQIVQWLPIPGPPEAEAGQTQLPPPPEDILAAVKVFLEKGESVQALNSLEVQAAIYPFWLDFHKARVDCLTAAGYDAAAAALKGEMVFFYSLYPGLRSLSFSDGTPLVSPETHRWLEESSSGKPAAATSDQDLKALTQGDPTQGLATLSQPQNRGTGGRGLLTVRLAEGFLWLKLGREDLALGLADYVLGELDAHQLDAWEPELCAQTLKALHELYTKLGPSHAAKAAAMALRVALISPDTALDLKASKS